MTDVAAALFGAQHVLRRAERELEQKLDDSYGVGCWHDYETDRNARSLDVYGVHPSPQASASLRAAGFAAVYQHDHDRAKFLRCVCRARPTLSAGDAGKE